MKSNITVSDDNLLNSKDNTLERLWVLMRLNNVKTAVCVSYFPNDGVNKTQTDALTNVLRYHTCRSSLREDRKLPITKLKWYARTVTDIPGNNAYWFFAFFWLTKGSRNKN